MNEELLARVERELERMATARERATYAELTQRLGIEPPHQIRKLVLCLEELMRRQARAGEPLLACLVASKIRDGLPAPGFFALAAELGCYRGDARAWHDAELARVFARY